MREQHDRPIKACRHCGTEHQPRPSRIKRHDWICKPCEKLMEQLATKSGITNPNAGTRRLRFAFDARRHNLTRAQQCLSEFRRTMK